VYTYIPAIPGGWIAHQEMRGSVASSSEVKVAAISYSNVWQSVDLTRPTAQSADNGQVKEYGRYIIT
jgi:hypothetical protein